MQIKRKKPKNPLSNRGAFMSLTIKLTSRVGQGKTEGTVLWEGT